LPTKSKEARSRDVQGRAGFSKEERARDGALAMMEYQANSRMARERMVRLRALRLAKEATDKEQERSEKAATGKR